MAFTFEKAKEILNYDSNQTIYKLLNELEKFNIVKNKEYILEQGFKINTLYFL